MSTEPMTFTVDYVGYDSLDHSSDFDDLPKAQQEAVTLSEHGCHCITITDSDCNEYVW